MSQESLSPAVNDALAIWQAGVDAVKPSRLFADKVHLDGKWLLIDECQVDLTEFRRFVIVGAGKASAAMAVAFHTTVLSQLRAALSPNICGWINAVEGTYTKEDAAAVQPIVIHPARPAGINEPTHAAVFGTQRILDLVGSCDSGDLVLCLLSGGGSAVLVAPKTNVSLTDKQTVAREVAAAGGDIQQLNTVRRALSDVKGGGLARHCNASRLITVVISDVLGDCLQTIASGPTMIDAAESPADALTVIEQLGLHDSPRLAEVRKALQEMVQETKPNALANPRLRIEHVILGNNSDAVDAAGVKAVELGYRYFLQANRKAEGDVIQVANQAAQVMQQLSQDHAVDCWISGGEPTVKLPDNSAGKGGRNQHLALAALVELEKLGTLPASEQFAFLSGGTDGEDGPTDAAGAWIDASTIDRAQQLGSDPGDYLRRADAYNFFDCVGGLIRSGPTGTNVCDLRIGLIKGTG